MLRSVPCFAAIALGVGCHGDETKSKASAIAAEALAPHVELEVPVLASMNGTREPAGGDSFFTLTGAPDEVAKQRGALTGRGPTLVAIAPKLTAQRAMGELDDLRRLGIGDVELLVRVGRARRVVVIEKNRARPSDTQASSVAVISAGVTIKISGGDAIALQALPQTLSRLKPDSVVILPEPDLDVQRLAEVIAACGGDVWLGSGTLPRVEPP